MVRPSVVLDTNVVVSAHLTSEGFEHFVLDLALSGRLQLYVSAEVLEEYQEVLSRDKFAFDKKLISESLALIRKHSKLVKPARSLKASSDPFDNKFLECAEEAEADFLVTGNKRHFPAKWRKSKIVNARELLEEIIPELKR